MEDTHVVIKDLRGLFPLPSGLPKEVTRLSWYSMGGYAWGVGVCDHRHLGVYSCGFDVGVGDDDGEGSIASAPCYKT